MGQPEESVVEAPLPPAVAIKPPDFRNIIARPDVQPGDMVKVGSPLFHDKEHPDFQDHETFWYAWAASQS